jgi:hypothetical protein
MLSRYELKSVNVIFNPYKSNRRVLLSFPNFILCGHVLANVNSCKYLGHWLSCVDEDSTDIENQTRLLYARTYISVFVLWTTVSAINVLFIIIIIIDRKLKDWEL